MDWNSSRVIAQRRVSTYNKAKDVAFPVGVIPIVYRGIN